LWNDCDARMWSRFYQYLGTTKHPVYEVKDGMISVKGKEYPIRLVDGFYIIRKLSVTECMRLQTVPQWYEFPVSNTQAYKMLGNSWTIEVIKHLIRSALEDDGSEKYELDDGEQLDGQTDIFDFI